MHALQAVCSHDDQVGIHFHGDIVNVVEQVSNANRGFHNPFERRQLLLGKGLKSLTGLCEALLLATMWRRCNSLFSALPTASAWLTALVDTGVKSTGPKCGVVTWRKSREQGVQKQDFAVVDCTLFVPVEFNLKT